MAAKRKISAKKTRTAARKAVKASKSLGISPVLLFLLALLCGVFAYSGYLEFGNVDVPEEAIENFISKDADLQIHYIDVGQGDCSLILWEGASMLIDSGESEYAEKVLDYLKENNVDKLDYVLTTHPHSDHMGSMSEIISAVDIGMVIAPKVSEELTPLTKTYEKFLLALQEKALKLTAARVGSVYTFSGRTAASAGKEAPEFEIIAPVDDYSNLNNYSVVIRLTYGSTSYLFTGDIEKKAENDILESGVELSSDVLKVAHHGSSSSTSEKFLEAVSPQISVIQCGAENDYGHPHAEVIELLDEYEVDYYRTDQCGTVVVYSDGSQIFVKTEEEK